MARTFAQFRVNMLLMWILSNIILIAIVLYFDYLDMFGLSVLYIICGTVGIRLCGMLSLVDTCPHTLPSLLRSQAQCCSKLTGPLSGCVTGTAAL